jgi:uncharacterized RDD family membrane protein YckC
VIARIGWLTDQPEAARRDWLPSCSRKSRSEEDSIVTTAYPKAPLDRRFLASLLDAAIACAPLGLAAVLVAIAATAASWGRAIAVGFLAGTPALVWAAYYGFVKDAQGRGQSIGKKKLGLMVVHLPTNAPCNLSQSALRALVMGATNLIPYLGWLVEPIVALSAEGGRRLGDQAAGTQVIAVESYRPAA